MPIPVSRLRTLLLASCAATLLLPTTASAQRTVPAELRVVNAAGKTLAEHTQYTSSVRIKTRQRADCFGPGTGGSGDRVLVPGATALGLVVDGTRGQKALQPLRITDAFDFGLGVCAIGGFDAPQTGFWYLKRNRAGSEAGGDQTRIEGGDRILWYLVEDFNQPTPEELVLRAPARARPDQPLTVRVLAFDDQGNGSPAAGAQVRGAGQPTDANGRATIPAPRRGTLGLQATRPGGIPSNRLQVCVRPRLNQCPRGGHRERILGTDRRDLVRAGRGSNVIRTFGGNDRIDLRRSRGTNRVNCGPGRDTVIARPGQRFQHSNCDRVVRRR